jgi:hypothetical protein
MKLRQPNAILLTLFIILFFIVACEGRGEKSTTVPDGTHTIDPIFQQFYEQLGGAETLGPGITPIFEKDEVLYQYTDRALLMYDRRLPKAERLRLAPLGRDLGIFELPPKDGDGNPVASVNGYPIFEYFLPLYNRLGGEKVVGKPLTAVNKNIDKNRYEQHFENLGFYWIAGEPAEAVGLLSYGAWRCDQRCRHSPPENSRIQTPARKVMPFLKEVAWLGLDFTGYARSEPTIMPDGSLEQVYDNVVLVINPEYPDKVYLLPLAERLGKADPALQPPSSDPNNFFYPVQDGFGYNVPPYFMLYVQAHGGIDTIGPPISPLTQPEASHYQQCFRNLCLQALLQEDGSYDVGPVPLGLEYNLATVRPQNLPLVTAEPVDIAIQVWEEKPLVSPDQGQVIGVVVYGNNLPLAGVEPELDLSPPDGSPVSYTLPPTDDEGESQIRIEPLDGKNGTLIPYKVCVNTPTAQKFCVLDSYLIWITEYAMVTPQAPQEYTSYLPFVVGNIQVYAPAVLDNFSIYIPLVTGGH